MSSLQSPTARTSPAKWPWFLLTAFVLAAIFSGVAWWRSTRASKPQSRADEVVYPGVGWQKKTPHQAGFDEDALDKFRDFVGGSGCVTRHGYVVYQWGYPHTSMDVASAGKPVIAFFVFKAIEKGLIPSLDSPVWEFEPVLAALNPRCGFKDKRITWRHLIYQTACYGESEEPGTAFDYNDYTMQLLWKTLFTKVYKVQRPEDLGNEVLTPLLAGPLGFQDEVEYYHERNAPYVGRLIISARDFCRFGYLFMQHGRWRDQQVLPEAIARMAVSTPLPKAMPRTKEQSTLMEPGQETVGGGANQEEQCGSYTCLWWMNGIDAQGRRLWPDAPPDTYGAFGYGGNRAMVVIPSLGIVASWPKSELPTVPMYDIGRKKVNEALRLLMQSVVSK